MENTLFNLLIVGDESTSKDILPLIEPFLIGGETVSFATKGLRDGAVFTSKRIITVDRVGITGKSVEFTTIPLSSIAAFKIMNSDEFDLDTELTLYGTGFGKAVMLFTKGFDAKKLSYYLTSAL